MVADPGLELTQRLALGGLGELGAELRLAAGPAEESTSSRATGSATSRPWSSSTSASARSMPAVTPAEV